MRKVFAAALLALAGLVTTGVAVANADETEVVDLRYATYAGCMADGPNVEITHNDHLYTHFDCRQMPDGSWHVFLSN